MMSQPSGSLIVHLQDRSYPVTIGAGLIHQIGASLQKYLPATRATIITDETVAALYAAPLRQSLSSAGIESHLVIVPPGEASKSIGRLTSAYDSLAAARHARDEPIIALGGGVVGDLAGFVAATWNRGVPFVQCPTTLEAAIDASIGGKTAINHPAGKNLIGAFHQPLFVCIDIDCLRTLSDRDYRAALAESVKHAIIDGPKFFAWHEANAPAILRRDPVILAELIRENCRIKAGVVSRDERESSTAQIGRAALNLGHTIGHALEAQSGFDLRHGEAVALGLIAALDLAVRLAGFPDELRTRAVSLLSALELPTRAPTLLNDADVLARISVDKKVRGSRVRFVVPKTLGEITWLDDPSMPDITAALRCIHPGP